MRSSKPDLALKAYEERKGVFSIRIPKQANYNRNSLFLP